MHRGEGRPMLTPQILAKFYTVVTNTRRVTAHAAVTVPMLLRLT
jgi:hypothetical protein